MSGGGGSDFRSQGLTTSCASAVPDAACLLPCRIAKIIEAAYGQDISPSLVAVPAVEPHREMPLLLESWKNDAESGSWRLGRIQGIPILKLPAGTTSAVYAVDLARFAHLTEFSRSRVRRIGPLTEARSQEIRANRPLTSQRDLEAQVLIEAWESMAIDVRDTSAVVGARVLVDTDSDGPLVPPDRTA